MTKPFIRKNGDVWQVWINDRAWNTRATWNDALTHGNRIAGYAQCIRLKRDINRIHASLERMEHATERAEEASLSAQYQNGPGRGMTNTNRATIARLKENR